MAPLSPDPSMLPPSRRSPSMRQYMGYLHQHMTQSGSTVPSWPTVTMAIAPSPTPSQIRLEIKLSRQSWRHP
ncbi:MAG: hypothetical protein VKK04_17430 [Synechococcales bacterium]|nr:hypothetical protein [Synechococcales bacterium]